MFAGFEYSFIRARQAEGIALTKKVGKHTDPPEQVQQDRERVAIGEAKAANASDLGIGRAKHY